VSAHGRWDLTATKVTGTARLTITSIDTAGPHIGPDLAARSRSYWG